MSKQKYIGKKLNPNTKIIENEGESEAETLDLKELPKIKDKTKYTRFLSKEVMGISSKRKESIINQKEESIDIKEDIFRPINNINILEEINELRKDIRELQKDNINLKKYNRKLTKDNEVLQKNIQQLKNDTQKNCNKLLNKIDYLENQIKELQEFHFSAKLGKLTKNLIGFIINEFYPKYMIYQEGNEGKENIFFFRAPRFPYNLDWAYDEEIIDSLNGILKLLFSTTKEKDSVFHFVEQKGKKNNNYYKRIFNVFNKPDDFFRFFQISKIDQKILIELIPKNYFTQIDNTAFEINIKDLMNKIAKEKKKFNNKKE